jgi:hypothetical protein
VNPTYRRFLGALTGASLVLAAGGVALAAGEGGGLGLPAAACNTYTDPGGDGVAFSTAPVPSPIPTDAGLDILGVVLGTSATKVATYVRVDDLINAPEFAEGDTWTVGFTAKGKAVTVTVERGDAQPVVDATIGAYSEVTVGGAAVTSVPHDVVYDETNDFVIISLDRAKLEAALGGALAGTSLTALSAESGTRYVFPTAVADQAAAPAGTAFAVDSNPCFAGGGTPGPTPTPEPSEEPEEEEPGEEEPEEEEPVDPFLPQPRAGCFLFKDAAGDAYPGIAPLSSPESDPDLDLTEVSLKSGISALEVFAKVTDLGASPSIPIFTGHSFSTSFSIGGKAFSVQALGTGPATSTPASMSATAKLDETANNVVFTIPLDDIETVLGAPLTAGTAITNLTVVSNASNPLGDFDGDTAAGATPAEKTHPFGNNACFMPPAGKLTLVAPASGAFSDKVTVVATLLDSEDEAVEDARVVLKAPGQADLSATTSDAGKATFVLPLTASARSIVLSAIFAGNPTVGAAGAGQPFTIKSETTLLKAVAGKGTVTATLTDNDKTAVAGKTVVFTVGKKVTKVVTNAKGVAVLKKQVKGSTVKVAFAGVKNFYVAAKSVSAKVL